LIFKGNKLWGPVPKAKDVQKLDIVETEKALDEFGATSHSAPQLAAAMNKFGVY